MRSTVSTLIAALVPALLAWPSPGQEVNFDPIERLLEELTNAHGPTGFEGPVREIVRREFTPLADEITTDGLGSLIARLDGSSDGSRIMLAAHMDEVRMIVKRITPEGYLKFQTLGGILEPRPQSEAYG